MKIGISNDQNSQLQNVLSPDNLSSVIRTGAVCILEFNNQFFLLVELEFEVGGEEIEQVIVIRISAAQAQRLLTAGIMRCDISSTFPLPSPGVEVNFLCVLVIDGAAFLVFDVENTTDRLVLVRADHCPIIG